MIPDLNRKSSLPDGPPGCIRSWAWWSARRELPYSKPTRRLSRPQARRRLAGLRGHRGRRGTEGSPAALLRRNDHGPRSPGPFGRARGHAEAADPAAAYLSAVASCCNQNSGNPKASSPAMQLLLERFNWHSGGCLARLPEEWPEPRVTVTLAAPPDPDAHPPRARPPAIPGDRAGHLHHGRP